MERSISQSRHSLPLSYHVNIFAFMLVFRTSLLLATWPWDLTGYHPCSSQAIIRTDHKKYCQESAVVGMRVLQVGESGLSVICKSGSFVARQMSNSKNSFSCFVGVYQCHIHALSFSESWRLGGFIVFRFLPGTLILS